VLEARPYALGKVKEAITKAFDKINNTNPNTDVLSGTKQP